MKVSLNSFQEIITLFDNADLAIFHLDANLTIIDFNAFASNIFENFSGLSASSFRIENHVFLDENYRPVSQKEHPVWTSIEMRKAVQKNLRIRIYENKIQLFRVTVFPFFSPADDSFEEMVAILIPVEINNLPEIELRKRNEMGNLVAQISTRFINLIPNQFEIETNKVLQEIGEFLKTDRAYIFLYSDDNSVMTCVYEWCAQGVKPEIEMLQNLPIHLFPWWNKKLQNNEIINIPNINNLPEVAYAEKVFLEMQDIKSVLVIPIIHTNNVLGYIGFDSVKIERNWNETEIQLLRLTSEIFSSGLQCVNTQELINQSDLSYKHLVDHAEKYISTFNNKGTFTFINAAEMQHIGLEKENIIGHNVFELFSQEAAKEHLSIIERVIKTGKSETQEFNYFKNNKHCWLRSSFYPIPPSKSGTQQVIKFSEDITDLRNVETELFQFQAIIEKLDIGILFENPLGELVFANSIFKETFNYPNLEKEKQAFDGIMLDFLKKHLNSDKDSNNQILQKIRNNEPAIGNVITTSENKNFILDFTPIYSGKNHLGNLWQFHLSLDLLNREETRKKNEERLEFALDGLEYGVWDWDLKNNSLYFSRQWKKMLGYGEKEINNAYETWKKLIHPDDLPFALNDLEDHFSHKTPIYQNEQRLLCKDGKYKWILDRGKVVAWDENGEPKRMIGTHLDITNKKEYEQKIDEALQKAIELSDLKSRFVSITSHEFRTPLSSIKVAAESLELYRERMTQAEIDKNLFRIKDNVEFLVEIMDKVSALSQLDSGNRKFELEIIEFNEFVSGIVEEFSSFPQNNHKFHLQKFDKLINTRIDKHLMRQVVNNLLSNSTKYSDQETTIEVKLEQTANSVILSVTDHGIGIPENEQKNIFDAFFRASNTGNIHGTGLGLPIAKQIMEQHKGKLYFESNANQGTTFYVELPLSNS